MTPYLVTPPASLPVALADLKAYLNIYHDEKDADIGALQGGAVAMLDAWEGLLGRCIMPQDWAVDVTGPGPHVLPFPDASDIGVKFGDDVLSFEVLRTRLGQCVTVTSVAPDQSVTITATYGLPTERLDAAQTLIKFMVNRDFYVMAGPPYDAMTRSIQALITALRVVKL